MLFSSTSFLFLFLAVMLLGYHLVLRRTRRGQNLFLLAGSLLFYAWGEPWFVLVMLGSIAANYLFGLWAHRLRSGGSSVKPAVILSTAANLLLLYIFKYLVFTLENLELLGFHPVIPGIHLPIGISFFTFQALSYVLDVAWGKAEVQRSIFHLGLYVSFFPQLIAGPIVKYADVAYQIEHRRDSWDSFSYGVTRFIIGFSKKVLLSNQLAIVADRAFGQVGSGLPASYAWLGALCYTLQIYYDFSGYSDMAIGLGAMFGFRFRENFNYPYFADSVTDFWRRWHISLSSWFRDYLYIPLGGSRTGKTLRNLFIVWLLTGIWHGANWTFIFWGLFHFCLLYLEKFHHLGSGWPLWLRRLFTFLMANFAWVFFRADSLKDGVHFIASMFGLHGWASSHAALFLGENLWILILSFLFMVPIVPAMGRRLASLKGTAKTVLEPIFALLASLVLILLLLISICYLVKGTYNPFIYFNF